jgi:hypothetical protein
MQDRVGSSTVEAGRRSKVSGDKCRKAPQRGREPWKILRRQQPVVPATELVSESLSRRGDNGAIIQQCRSSSLKDTKRKS